MDNGTDTGAQEEKLSSFGIEKEFSFVLHWDP